MIDVERLVAVAHRRLQLRRMLVAIERNPKLLDGEGIMALTIRKPTELAGLKSRMIRVEGQEKAIAAIGRRYDRVLDGIDELRGAHLEHVGDLEHYERDLRNKIEGMVGSNGGDPLDDAETGQTGQQSPGAGQIISSETPKGDRVVVAEGDVGKVADVVGDQQ